MVKFPRLVKIINEQLDVERAKQPEVLNLIELNE